MCVCVCVWYDGNTTPACESPVRPFKKICLSKIVSLTLRRRPGVKRQNVTEQMARNKDNSLSVAQVNGKSGLSNLNYDN